MKTKSVSLYTVTLLNGDDVVVKNNTGDKVEKLKNREYIRDYSFLREVSRREFKSERVMYDLDKFRSLRSLHKLLVLNIYMGSEA